MAWMSSYGFCSTPADERAIAHMMSADLAGHWFPDQPTERVQWMTDLWSFYAFVDDQRLEVGDATEPFLGQFVGQMSLVIGQHRSFRRETIDSPLLCALHDLTRRVHEMSTPAQAARYTAGLGNWLMAVLADDKNRNSRDLSNFLVMRLGSIAALFMLECINVLCPEPVPAHEWHHPKVVAAGQAAMLVAACDNEMFSYGKERFLAEGGNASGGEWQSANLVRFLESRGSSITQAFATVADFRNRSMWLWCRLKDQLRPTASPALASLLHAIDYVIAGTAQHHSTSSRYHDPDGQHPHAITFDISYASDDPVTNHNPIAPSLAWWWEQLAA
ncbi:terpene synthase family protein [Streptomyces sp. cmx-4-9]|uniref:terpene synthase family protein n=1 Tax=Streptomyces sp. cmx-4-9 TaxID=2790941 RepID=UPI0039814963